MMPVEKTVQSALEALKKALNQLDNEVDRQVEASRSSTEAAAELDRMIEDRTRIALELDQSQDRANRLEEANREVSRRSGDSHGNDPGGAGPLGHSLSLFISLRSRKACKNRTC
jgi:Sec-independent protein translocase protein TatA